MQAVWLVLVTNSLFCGSPIIHIFYIIGTKRCQFALGHAKLAMRISYSLSYQPPLPSPSKLLMSIFDHSGEHCFRSVPHELEGKRIHTYKEIKDSTCWSTWKDLSMILRAGAVLRLASSCWKFSWKYYINTINPPRYDIPREVFLSWAFRKIVNVSTKRMVQFTASTEISEHRLIVLILLRQFIYKC